MVLIGSRLQFDETLAPVGRRPLTADEVQRVLQLPSSLKDIFNQQVERTQWHIDAEKHV